jgi:hypothetical protein
MEKTVAKRERRTKVHFVVFEQGDGGDKEGEAKTQLDWKP